MTTTEERRGENAVLIEFMRSRVSDEIARESHLYHHDTCEARSPYGYGQDCSCDGPERTSETLTSVLCAVEEIAATAAPGFPGSIPLYCRKVLIALSTPYRRHADFPRISDDDAEARGKIDSARWRGPM